MNVNFAYNYTFDGANYLSSVTNNLGRSLTLAYSGAHVSTVTDDTGRSVSYTYDAANNLASAVDPLQFATSFAYDATNRLTQVFYPANPGNPFVTNVYDALGRVNQQANANGNFSFFYLAGARTELIDSAGDRHVTYQTPRGKIIKDAFVLNGSVGNVYNDVAQQNGLVNVSSNQYDGLDRLTRTIAPEGGNIAYGYDAKSNILSITATPKPGSPLAPLVTTYSYDSVFSKPTRMVDPRGLVTTSTYDGMGNLFSQVVDAGIAPHFNAQTNFTYNGIGRVLTATDPRGSVTQYGYDGFGNPTSIVRDAGSGRLNQLTSLSYSPQGDAVSVTDPNGNVTTRAYDANRQLIQSTSPTTSAAPGGVVTALNYDPNGQLIGQSMQSGGTVLQSISATYTLTGKAATATDANGNTTVFAYDVLDRLSSVTDAMGRVTSYGYDAMSRRTQVSNLAIQPAPLLQQAYTPDGLLASLTDANSHATGFAYDGFDRLATTTYPLGSTEALTYDADSNVLTRKTRANQTIAFSYDTLNRLATKTPPSPAPVVSYGYDLNSRLTGVSDTSAAIAAAVPPSGSSVGYATSATYDALNRPTAIAWSPAPAAAAPAASSVTFGHAYNKANLRTGQTVTDNSWLNYPAATPSTVSYTANALNQYTAVGAVTPSYDGNGNLTSDGTFTFGYDAENRLTSASGAGNIASYAFDAQGRRKSKTVNGSTTVFVTDAGNREVMEYDGASGAILRWYAYGLGSNDVLSQTNVAAATRAALIPDIQGSVIASLNSATAALTKIGYLPYGKSASAPVSFGYTGQRIDPETNGLYYYRARHYSSAWGRFLQANPIGYSGGIHLYAYVGNDPGNAIDPTGLDTVVIITRDPVPLTGGFLTYGSHAAVRVDNGNNPILYDPAGSYHATTRGSGDALYGTESNLSSYTTYQNSLGSTVNTYRFATTPAQEEQLAGRIEERGGAAPCFCSSAVSDVLNGIGPFRGVGSVVPGTLEQQLRKLPGVDTNTIVPSGGNQSSASSPTNVNFVPDPPQSNIQSSADPTASSGSGGAAK